MSVWTLGGFEAAANVAEETHMPEKRIPTAIVLSEIIAELFTNAKRLFGTSNQVLDPNRLVHRARIRA